MHSRIVWLLAIFMAAGAGWIRAQGAAETVLYNGKVLTVDKSFSVAQAVAVRGDKILAVGTNDEAMKAVGPNAVKIDLKGKTVTPGLIHTHVHLESLGGYRDTLPALKRKEYPLTFTAVKTKEDVIKQIQEIIAAFKFPAGEWLYFPANPQGKAHAKILFDELNVTELNKAAPNNPIFISVGMPKTNIGLLNGVAMDWLFKKYGSFIQTYGRYWIDASGKPSGMIETPMVRIVWEDPEIALNPAPADAGPMYRRVLEEQFSSLGITTISGALDTDVVKAYQWLDSRGEMPLRYGYGSMAAFVPGTDMKGLKLGAGTENVFITSMSARAVDGAGGRMCISLKRDSAAAAATASGQSLMGFSAAADWWPRGQCSLDIEYSGGTRGARVKANYFLEWYNQVAANGLRSANSHVSGNDSYARLISEWERIDRAKPGAVKGWAVDHCTLISPDDLKRAAKLGVMASCSPLGEGDRPDQMAVAFDKNVVEQYVAPIKTMLDLGMNVSLEGEWEAIELLVTRKGEDGKIWAPDQRVDRKTALIIATQNGANYVLKGDKLGSIEKGKLADLVVIDKDYMTVPEDQISEMRALMTVVGGKTVFLNTGFATEHNLKPAGAVISTYEELQKRRPAGGFGGG